jgi:1,4-dihydroxy-2-naphthoate octaprenyltransferase
MQAHLSTKVSAVLLLIAMLCTVLLAIIGGPRWPSLVLWSFVFVLQMIILFLRIRKPKGQGSVGISRP